ncbi:MAG: UDP-N-acetylmuramoyl-tripeptide--D-alanyl-D-alanine ligase [Chitinophagaceae bacterium]|nr:UDP-N-acetylmuramoyl-tripeptide--D-alanyl-D-alanine ligase [Chitinophagaceae bacterium]
MNISELYSIFCKYPNIQIDSRKVKKDDIFFALKGPNFNGNLFALKALQVGATYAVTDEGIKTHDERIIKVDDALATLQALAKYHREQFNIPFIAITGSNGKTTTKELLSSVLASYYKTYTTQGNLNNHIGVPLTLLSIKKDAEMAVIEMGANHQKEIESYCSYTLPTHGIITNCGKAHLEGFGGTEGVKKGKGELFDFIRNNNGYVFLNTDYKYLQEMSKGIQNIYRYGSNEGALTGTVKMSEPFLEVQITKGTSFQELNTHLVGEYNLANALCAVAVGKFFKVPDEKIKAAIENYIPSNSRSQLVEKGSNKIIMDAYNANPSSMKAAIENFAKLGATNKVLMLGGMMELGEESLKEHATIVELIKQYQWNHVVLVGGDYNKIKHSFTYFDTAEQAREWFLQQHFKNMHLLVKGSRSMQMERVIED